MTTRKANTRKPGGRPRARKSAAREEGLAPAATTAAILGLEPSDPAGGGQGEPGSRKEKPSAYQAVGVKAEWEKFYLTLVKLHDRLVAQMNGLARESAEHMPSYSLHLADSGTDNFDRDFALSLLSSDQDALNEINEALKRIENGTYGVCELTGKPIPKTRLEAIPWTRFTKDAQEQMEREGVLRQRRLGTLGSIKSANREAASEMLSEPESEKKQTTR